MGKCTDENISLNFISPSGKFLAKVTGKTKGNVLLRRQQYRFADDQGFCLAFAKNIIAAKLSNTRFVLSRAIRDHKDKVNVDKIQNTIDLFKVNIEKVYQADLVDSVRGLEGESARRYFDVFDEIIVKQKDDFHLNGRTKRPPLDKVNAMLSYMYTILGFEIQSALESVGIDPYVGFLHTDRAGRASLALDLIEELRAYMVDRLILSMINLVKLVQAIF